MSNSPADRVPWNFHTGHGAIFPDHGPLVDPLPVGLMSTPELAMYVVELHNRDRVPHWRVEHVDGQQDRIMHHLRLYDLECDTCGVPVGMLTETKTDAYGEEYTTYETVSITAVTSPKGGTRFLCDSHAHGLLGDLELYR